MVKTTVEELPISFGKHLKLHPYFHKESKAANVIAQRGLCI
jgi:hypothetical protein